MPEYYSNPLAGDPRIQQSMSRLGEMLANGPNRRLEAEIAGRQGRADLDNTYARTAASYSQVGANEARARQYAAAAALDEDQLAAVQEIGAVWSSNPNASFDERMAAIAPLAIRAGLKPEQVQALVGLSPAFGLGYDEIDLYNFASGGSYDNTKHKFDNLPVAVIDNGVPSFSRQGDLVGSGVQPVLSETQQKGLRFGLMPIDDQTATIMGQTGPISVLGDNNIPTTMSEYEAIRSGARPVLSETQEKGVSRATGGAGDFGLRLEVEGSGTEQNAIRILETAIEMERQGLPLPDGQRALLDWAIQTITEPKISVYEDPATGVQMQRTIPGKQVAYIPYQGQSRSGAAPATGAVGAFDTPQVGQPPQVSGFSDARPPAVATPPPLPPQSPPGQVTISEIPGQTPAPPKPPTEAQARYGQYTKRILSGAGSLMAVLGYNPETGEFRPNAWRQSAKERLVNEYAPDWGQPYLLDREAQLYNTSVAQTLNPLIRADSGAAVPEQEYPRYYAQYIPQAGEDDATAKLKLDHLAITVAAFAEVSQLPVFKDAMASADYSRAQTILHAAKYRIAGEIGLNLEEIMYGAGAAPATNVPTRNRVLMLPGNQPAERVN